MLFSARHQPTLLPPHCLLQATGASMHSMAFNTMEKSLRIVRLLFSAHAALARKTAPLRDDCEHRAAIGLRLYRSAGLDCHVIRLDPIAGQALELSANT